MLLAFINPESTLHHPEPTELSGRLSAGLSQLLRAAELVPVTGMDEEELLSVPTVFTSWQVLLYGAVLIGPDGLELPAWRRLTLETQHLRAEALHLAHQAANHISQLGQLGLEVELLERNGLPLCIRMTHPHGLELALNQGGQMWQEWLDDGPFQADLRLLKSAARFTLLPREITPESAVNYLLNELAEEPDLTIGLSAQEGDSGFLALCDYAMIPGASDWLNRIEAASPDDF